MTKKNFTLNLACDDKPGIGAGITSELAALGGNIIQSNQHHDDLNNPFFMSVAFERATQTTVAAIESAVAPIVARFGATAHYVTADLDEGPIIEQETERASQTMTAEDFVAAGRDIESRVLAQAVKLHVEGRIMVNGHKAVVFR